MVQEHGGALRRGNTLEAQSRGGQVAAERRRARAQRSEEIDDAMLGYAEKFLELVGRRLKEAGGKQHRCACGRFGPRIRKLTLTELTTAVVTLSKRGSPEAVTVIPFQVIVAAGGPIDARLGG